MFKLKGRYDWKLTDAGTGEIVKEGSQWNVVSDSVTNWVFKSGPSPSYSSSSLNINGMAILLSDSTMGSDDYRRYNKSSIFNILSTGTTQSYAFDTNNLSKYTDHNFSPPASPRTITIIGVKIFNYTTVVSASDFVSFIQLSTPITQNTDQYLYVKYTLFFILDTSVGYNTPNNRFVEYSLRQTLHTLLVRFGNSQNIANFKLTAFLPPVNKNNVARIPSSVYTAAIADATYTSNYYHNVPKLSRFITKNFAVADIVGPIGVSVFSPYGISLVRNAAFTFGYSKSKVMDPTVARIFVHPGTRDAYVFSDPSYPASSQGSIVVTGTPTNKYPVLARVRITKTGDASDLVDEVVNYTAVDTGNSQITIAQDFTTGDIYQATSTGTLPSPLLVSTNYYIIRIDSTHIRLATSYANAIAGTYITLTTQGTGDHTFIRQNTGKYRLESEPWNYKTGVTPSYLYLSQLPMAIDFDGYVMPAMLESATELAEGDYPANNTTSEANELFFSYVSPTLLPWSASMVRHATKNGDYIYTIQQSRKGLINNICRWTFNTIETSQPLCKFGTGITKVVVAISTATKMYIATTDGIYEYTFATPTTAPVLLTITGMIASTITDMCLDPVTGYFWTGHTTGLSRIDMGALTATQYISGVGEALDGMTSTYYNIGAGQLDAYNGRVLKGGYANGTINDNAWVMDDGVGWYRINLTCFSCCLIKGTANIFFVGSTNDYVYSVTVTGKGTGSYSQIETFVRGASVRWPLAHVVQISSNKFYYLFSDTSTGYNNYTTIYTVGSGCVNTFLGAGFQASNSYDKANYFAWSLGAFRKNVIDVDGNGNIVFIWNSFLVCPHLPANIPYGWNGSAWIKDLDAPREIPKTATHSLINGLSVDFNNATGSSWDVQFVLNESFNILHAPYPVKDNLQTLQWKAKQYYCNAIVVESYSAAISGSVPYLITIPEVSDPNFRDMDVTDFVTEVYEGTTVYPQYTPTQRTATGNATLDTLTVGVNIATGTPVVISSRTSADLDGSLYYPLEDNKTYYAINYNSTTIRLATTYANALVGTYIDINPIGLSGSTSVYFFAVTPTAGTYFSTASGDFFFNAADAGKTMTLTYTYTKFTV